MTEDHSSNTIGAPPPPPEIGAPPPPPPPPSSILFTYKPDQIQLEIDKRADLKSENVDEQEKAKAALAGWFPIDYAKAILEGAQKSDTWLGIGKRPAEVVKRWQAGQEMHPWLPETIAIIDPSGGRINLVAADAAPITKDTLCSEVAKLLELYKLSQGTIMQSITVKPAWRAPAGTKTDLAALDFDEDFAWQLRDVAYSTWQTFLGVTAKRFRTILPNLGLDPQGPPKALNPDNCIPDRTFDCDGLCGAWYIVEVQYCIVEPNGSNTQKHLKIRIPVGLLLKPVPSKGDPKPPPAKKVSFNDNKSKVYTYGPDFRFLCEEDVKDHSQNMLADQLKSRLTFLNAGLRPKSLAISAHNSLMVPLERFTIHGSRDAWRGEQDSEKKAKLAADIAPHVVGKEPLAIFTETGVHLLQSEMQIGAWCAKSELLRRLFCSPPWSSDAKWLDEKIARVWSGNSWTPTTRNWPGGKQALEDEVLVPQGSPPIPSASGITDRLASVLGSKGKGIGDSNETDWDRIIVQKSIEDFRKLKEAGQIGFINDLWNILTTAYPFDKPVRQMYEPTASDNSDLQEIGKQYRPLPTAWQPDGFSKAKYESSYGRLLSEGGKWRELGVGFRVEGELAKLQETLKRLEKNGMTQWRLDKHLMAKTSGFYIEGTLFDGDIPGNLDRARFWNGNHDILNQTAVCVSRNLFGATAFPERWSKGDFILFAVDCSNLQGCDTEQKQIDIFQKYKGDQKYKDERKRAEIMRWWRPGEKAFKEIKWENIIGWVPFTKEGQPPGTGWKFKIDAGANWTINQAWKATASLYVKKMAHIDNELGTWRGEHIVPYDFDFVAYP